MHTVNVMRYLSVFVLGVAQRSSGSSSGSYKDRGGQFHSMRLCVKRTKCKLKSYMCHYYHPLYGINHSHKYIVCITVEQYYIYSCMKSLSNEYGK